MSDGDLYSRLLLPKGHGYPLSHPQPFDDLPAESRTKGTEIGDVGVLTPNGSFDVFFNICRESDDPVNRFGVPYGFETVDLVPGDVASMASYHRSGSHVSNTTISKRRLDVNAGVQNNVFLPVGAGAEVEISTSSKRTAVLLLPDGASRTDLRFPDKFRDHALKHAKSWYDFLSSLGRTVDNGELYLVTGVDKSASWSVAAVENYTEDCTISLKLKAAQIGSAGASYVWEWETVARFADSGPRRPPGEDSGAKNQTVFLRGFRIAIPSLPWSKKTIAIPIVEPQSSANLTWFRTLFFRSPSHRTHTVVHGRSTGHDVLRDEEFEPIVYSPTTHRPYHPANAINKYLVTASSEVLAVVTHDSEWASVLGEDEDVPTDVELIRRICEKYSIGSTSGGRYLQQRDTDDSLTIVIAAVQEFRHRLSLCIAAVQEFRHLPLRIASLLEFGHWDLHTCMLLLIFFWLLLCRLLDDMTERPHPLDHVEDLESCPLPPPRMHMTAPQAACLALLLGLLGLISVLFMSVVLWVYVLKNRLKRLQRSLDRVEKMGKGRLDLTNRDQISLLENEARALKLRPSMSQIQERRLDINRNWSLRFRAAEISRDIRECEQGLQKLEEMLRRERSSDMEPSHMQWWRG